MTFLVVKNGTGKYTLVEAIATAAGFNPEGDSRSLRFATAPDKDLRHLLDED